ncbi:putative sensory transduction regulator [Jatrophihabitans sp. GAS493]|uniref:YbjN domain-containing protein n=1 Tax=Jatrophihabitans sp. GAS493 TaxID=1907575 RepID=UPI000BB77DDF|nr:YbjN domain-containing protein [Jatrophihabitans sp. GAS493]SOD70964.1 putative sensory transduction regulator [Jatrophihabitans sp. GAS493]
MSGPKPLHRPLRSSAERVYLDNGWPATAMEDGTGFTLYIEGSENAWSALALTDDESSSFAFYSLSPVDAAPADLDRMAEYLHRANLGLLSGTFELDYDSGEVRLRSGLDFATLSPELLADDAVLDSILLDLSAANVGTFDRYLVGLVAITLGSGDPADIIREIEQPEPDEIS